MSDDEFSGLAGSGATGGGGGGSNDKRAPRFSWTPAYEATFFQSLCESVQLGLRENHSFKAEAWDRAVKALSDKHGAYPTKSHLVNKSDNARKKFRLWRGLREDPDFIYNPVNRTVTASDEAWKSHIEREPLSRALRGRAFEHEAFMEILYPDVVGSGGAPKRIMKPKRKGPDAIQDPKDPDMPGTAILDLQVDSSPFLAATQPIRATSSTAQAAATAPTHVPAAAPPTRPTSTAIPPRTHIAGTSALTPPEETATQGRKRFPNQPAGAAAAAASSSGGDPKAGTSGTMGPPPPMTSGGASAPHEKRRRISSYTSNQLAPSANGMDYPTTASIVAAGRQALEDGLIRMAEALKGRTTPRWPEQALEIFFRDFADEDMDLQLKIAEKVFSDDNKAMIFCKMPTPLRKHWVKRLREVHNNRPAPT